MSRGVNHALEVAKRKVNAPDGWKIARWQVIGNTQDVLIDGCVPDTFKSGPRKGQDKFTGKKFDTCVVTRAEERAEFARYEADTGNCGECGGTKEVWAGWSVTDGTRYRPCRRCGATGKAPHTHQGPQDE